MPGSSPAFTTTPWAASRARSSGWRFCSAPGGAKRKGVTSDAAILRAVIYTRENQHAYARKLLTSISKYFPRNPLFFMEVGRSFEHEGKHQDALGIYLEAARRLDANAPGYDKVPRERPSYA